MIQLDLARAVDMFDTPTVELGSERGTFQPGIDLCIVELEGRPTGRPVQVEITLPQSEISTGLEEQLAVTMRRYCDERSYTNDCKRRSTQRSGLHALRIGLPVTLFGLATSPRSRSTWATATIPKPPWSTSSDGSWRGSGSGIPSTSSSSRDDYVRETPALDALRDAQVTVVPRPTGDAGEPAPADVID